MLKEIRYPYSAIVGQEDFKLALELNLIDRSIGGVLVVGDKGTGKTTTVRSLSQLMEEIQTDFNLVNLPIGASEDRVLGSADLEKLINEKKQILQKGLLAQAHQGILYIDEINLLPDYLTDILLDAAASGGYHLEREGLSLWQPSQFCLVGTMNPEEGELRPQLLDRFGLCVEVKTPTELSVRKTISQRRIVFDQAPKKLYEMFQEQESRIQQTIIRATAQVNTLEVNDELYEYACNLGIMHEVEGVRADILLIKAAKAYTALLNQSQLTFAHIDRIAPLVLRHRAKSTPTNQANKPQESDGQPSNQSRTEPLTDSENPEMNDASPSENFPNLPQTQHFSQKLTDQPLRLLKKK